MNLKLRAAFALLVLGLPLAVRAAVPAPPVNQFIGMPDTVFSALQEADCRLCHNTNPPANIPVDPTYLPDRHHLLVESAAIVPPRTAAPNGTPGQTYECLSCHTLEFNPATRSFVLVQNFRNCLLCHRPLTNDQGVVIGTVHHGGTEAQRGNCAICHGTLVDNGLIDADGDGRPDAANWVPTYNPSLVTPAPSGKANAGPNGEGNCTFCHSTGAANGAPNLDPLSGVLVYGSAATHHNTGFGSDPTKCFWCHTTQDGGSTMRRCENCHGIPSLHAIQVDSPDPGAEITPGSELPWYGHVGAQGDCWGCHGFTFSAQSLGPPPMAAVMPTISEVSTASVRAGQRTPITITGKAFINAVQNPVTGTYDRQLTSNIVLTDDGGNKITLEPAAISQETMEVVLPPSLPKGTYRMTATKATQSSNPVVISVTPAVKIFSAVRSGATVTLRGGGFGQHLNASDSGLSIKGKLDSSSSTFTETAEIVSWTPTQIVVSFSAPVHAVEVTTLFDKSTALVTAAATAPPTPQGTRGRLGRVLNLFAGSQLR